MVDPATTIGAGLAIWGSKDLLLKVLGPTADYIGGEIQGLVEKCHVNLDQIFQKAAKKLGPRMEEDGSVSPRILKSIIDEGRFCDDGLTAEYYGGVLASSKSKVGRDDRGVTLLALLRELSAYQIRFHFVAYTIFHKYFKGDPSDLGMISQRIKLEMFIPWSVLNVAMDFGTDEREDKITTHCLYGLRRRDLIGSEFASGDHKNLVKTYPGIAPEGGVVVAPTIPGAELYLWAMGIEDATGHELFRMDIDSGLEGVKIKEGSQSTSSLRFGARKDVKYD